MRYQIALLLLLCLAITVSTQATCTGALATTPNGCDRCKVTESSECQYCLGGYGSVTASGCTLCPTGKYSLGGPGAICLPCGLGMTTDGPGKSLPTDCYLGITDCTSYSVAKTCTACVAGKKLVNQGTACVTPIEGCDTQITANQCLSCVSGLKLTLTAGSCVAPIPDCEGHGASSTCLVCSFGYYPASDQKSCSKIGSTAGVLSMTVTMLLAIIALLF